jgi:hypothetical protein
MNGDATREPRMPGIQKLTEHRPVGVLKRCCTIIDVRTRRWPTGRRWRFGATPPAARSEQRLSI